MIRLTVEETNLLSIYNETYVRITYKNAISLRPFVLASMIVF